MEIRKIVLARSIQALQTATGTVGYLPDLVAAIKNKYSFFVGPKEEELFAEPPKGATFKHGRLLAQGRTIIIDTFTMFNDAVVADTSSSTDDNDIFLDDLSEWAKTAIPKAATVGPRYYLSQIEIRMARPLEAYTPAFRPVGELITALLDSYGIKVPRYEATALNLHFDPLGKVQPQPGVFFIDRRLNVPYSENIWFAQAPLKTKDHIKVLESLER